MSIRKRWPFNERMVRDAPDCRGIYVLWQDGAPLAVGHAPGGTDSIQSRLLAHLEHAPVAVSHYSWEICADPRQRRRAVEAELGLRRAGMASEEAS
jgi:hypothetical protein